MANTLNRVRVATSTTGQGTVTLGSAVTGYNTVAEGCGVARGTYAYLLEEGDDYEYGIGVYTASGTTFTRATVTKSKIAGSAGTTKMTLAGAAAFSIIARAEDIEVQGEVAAINTQTASYTLTLGDKGQIVEMDNASANNLTVPPNSSVAFPIKSRIDIVQKGAGQTTVVAGSGVTIRSSGSRLKLFGQWSGACLYKRGTDEWVLIGDIVS